jgi:hypothetical protein
MGCVLSTVRAAVESLPTVAYQHGQAFEMNRFAVTILAFVIARFLADSTFDHLGFPFTRINSIAPAC